MAGREAWDPARPGAAVGVCVSVWSPALGEAVRARVAAGESISAVCTTPGMPDRHTVNNWKQAHPEFGQALTAAMRTARLAERARDRAALAQRPARSGVGRPSTYSLAKAHAICERLSNGESLTAIGRDPDMPCFGTVLAWVRKHPEFADLYAEARQLFADWMFDEARDVAQASTHATVWSDRLRFDTIRWMTARMAPRKYCERLVIAAEIAQRETEPERLTIRMVDFHKGPNGKILVAPPRNAAEAANWEEAYGKPYDGPT
jgi:transposase-like protein